MTCPRCNVQMQEASFTDRLRRPVVIDICHDCQALWFDTHESVSLTPGSTLALFRTIGENVTRPRHAGDARAKCPRCGLRLRHTHDRQRTTQFEYLRCPAGHGRFTTFFDFLREKDFIRPLTAEQIAELRQNVDTVNCSNCGAPVNVTVGAACAHCGSPLSMLDLTHAERLVSQLQQAEARANQLVDPTLAVDVLRARRETERAFASLREDDMWFRDVAATGLVGAGLAAVARWFRKREE